jgi:hypothetical protein
MDRPNIWIIDTSVFLNILDVGGFNQNRAAIISDFRTRIEDGDTFFLPYAAILETGNHIAQLHGNVKFTKAEEFVTQVRLALTDQAPFNPLRFPEKDQVINWIEGFPEKAGQGIGFGDFSIIKDWEGQRAVYPGWSVRIWSLDQDLQGYES